MNLSELQLAIVTPLGKAFEGQIIQVVAPGVEGSFAVQRGHAAFLSALTAGLVRVHGQSEDAEFAVDGGFLEVRANDVTILANWAQRLDAGQDLDDLLKARRDQLAAK